MNNLLVFGGTFDPIHLGHLNTAMAIQQIFHFDRVAFLPCKTPVLNKQSTPCTATHRLNMLKLALAQVPKDCHFCVDARELNRESPSYTVTTLEEMRTEYGAQLPITLLIGQDAFYQLSQWHQWTRLIKLANLLVIERPGYGKQPLPQAIESLLTKHQTHNPLALLETPKGLIARFDAGEYPISSTMVREGLQNNSLVSDCLPDGVNQYIIDNELYGYTR